MQDIASGKAMIDAAHLPHLDRKPAIYIEDVVIGRTVETPGPEEGRAALSSLRASTTQKNDLAEALDRAGAECAMNVPITFLVTVDGASRDMHPIVRDEVYRIGYEAIRNACTHSRGKNLKVTLRYARDVILCLRDDGIGIGQSVLSEGKDGHFGLRGMQERAERI
jgi:signal transduction histidine kinase